jgi:hypothetical protein|tara:strand:+ start:79 stop:816 length:738 start_codon:yes stop_codon:yes gene_type:complete
MSFTFLELALVALIFIWIGFVRTGLGFGGVVLGLPLLMLVGGSPIDWLPVIGIHLIFFSGISLSNSLKKIDWAYLKTTLPWILPAKILGVIGLISLPPNIMTVIVYAITSFYAFTWILDRSISSQKSWVNNVFLVLGGYISGTSMNGAPLLVAVYMRHIVIEQLRNTLFVLWFFLVSIKMGAFLMVGVYIDWRFALMLIPIAAIGHFFGLKAHDKIIAKDVIFKRFMGSVLLFVCVIGLVKVFSS